jgi:hypothetical protein
MGFDYTKEKPDAESVSVPYPDEMRTRTCKRCGQPWWVHEMVQVGGREDQWYCIPCYDRPYGEDQHIRGDYPK